jgi:hypothetical protein
MTDAASDAIQWLAAYYVEHDFPHIGQWSFRLPAQHAGAANELVALRVVRRGAGGLWLTPVGLAWIMRNRPDLDDDTWSNEADDFRDQISAKYEAAGFPPYQSFPLGELGKRLRGELRALGLIVLVTRRSGMRLTLAGQAWLMKNLAA